MKCPKCKYVTFDYLDTCPRCGKNMSSEKTKLNISGIKPNPPFALGSLTGDLDDSGAGLTVPESVRESAGDMELKDDAVYDDGSELDIKIEDETIADSDDVAEIDLGELGLTDEDKGVEVEFASDKEGEAEKQEAKEGPEELDLDLDSVDLKLDFEEDEESEK